MLGVWIVNNVFAILLAKEALGKEYNKDDFFAWLNDEDDRENLIKSRNQFQKLLQIANMSFFPINRIMSPGTVLCPLAHPKEGRCTTRAALEPAKYNGIYSNYPEIRNANASTHAQIQCPARSSYRESASPPNFNHLNRIP
jgi:hypothetical protein